MILVGSLDRETAIARIESGDADLIAFGRTFLANPDLPRRLRGEDTLLNEVDYSTFYTQRSEGIHRLSHFRRTKSSLKAEMEGQYDS